MFWWTPVTILSSTIWDFRRYFIGFSFRGVGVFCYIGCECFTNLPSLLITKFLTNVKEKLQTQVTVPQHIPEDVNSQKFQRWRELSVSLKQQNFSKINNTKTYEFSTLYRTIHHEKLKTRLLDTIDNCFFKTKNGIPKCSLTCDQASKKLLC